MKLPISIGILAWNSGITLENTLQSYKNNGLLEMVSECTILFQEVSETDKKIAEKYNKIQNIVSDFIQLILEAKSGDSDIFESCSMLDELNEESIEIKTFWDGLQCRGYEVLFDLKTKI